MKIVWNKVTDFSVNKNKDTNVLKFYCTTWENL